MTLTSLRDGESVKEMPKMQCAKCKWLTADPDYGWCPIDGNILNTYPAGASYSIAHPPEKVAADEEVTRPVPFEYYAEDLGEQIKSYFDAEPVFTYMTRIESSLASSAERVEELEAALFEIEDTSIDYKAVSIARATLKSIGLAKSKEVK